MKKYFFLISKISSYFFSFDLCLRRKLNIFESRYKYEMKNIYYVDGMEKHFYYKCISICLQTHSMYVYLNVYTQGSSQGPCAKPKITRASVKLRIKDVNCRRFEVIRTYELYA